MSNELKRIFGYSAIATQGVTHVGGSTAIPPIYGDPKAIDEMMGHMKNASDQCPNTKIVAGAYS